MVKSIRHAIHDRDPSSWGVLLLLDRIISSMGIKIKQSFLQHWAKNPMSLIGESGGIPKIAVTGMGDSVKHMNIISHAHGYVLKHELQHMDAIEHFEAALNSSSYNKVTLRNLASEYKEIWGKDISKQASTDPAAKVKIRHIENLFSLAVEADPHDTHTWFQFAHFLEGVMGKSYKAMECALQSLIADILHDESAVLYVMILARLNLEAEKNSFAQLWEHFKTRRADLEAQLKAITSANAANAAAVAAAANPT